MTSTVDDNSRSAEDNEIIQLPPEPVSQRIFEDDPPGIENPPEPVEDTPLLARRQSSDVERSDSSDEGDRLPRRSWWTIISITILLLLTLNIIIFAFVLPTAAKTYATDATTYTIYNLEVQEFTDTGAIAHAQVNVTTDSSRVSSSSVRNFGVFVTTMFQHVSTQPCLVTVFLPQYNGAQVALVELPAIRVNIRNRHVNILDIVSNVTITDQALAVQLARDILAGRRKKIEAIAETDVHIKAGIIPLGRHHVRQQVVVQGH
jgi:hypothetical protein